MKLETVKEISRSDILFCAARAPHSTRLFVGSSDGGVYAVDVADEKPEFLSVAKHEGYVTGVALAGGLLVSGAYDGRLVWTDVESGQQVRSIEAHSRWIRGVESSPDGTVVASVADDMVCRLWSAETGQLLRELKGHSLQTPAHFPSMLFACAFSPDGAHLATADKTGRIIVWSVETGEQAATLDAPLMYTWDPKQRIHSIGGIRSLAFSPDGVLLAAGGIGQIGNIDHLDALARVEVFDWRKTERMHEFAGDTHKGLAERLTFFPDGRRLFVAGGDHGGFFQVYDLETGKIDVQDKAPMHVHDVVFGEDFTEAYAVGHGRVAAWRITGHDSESAAAAEAATTGGLE